MKRNVLYDYSYRNNKADYLLSLTASIQPALSIMQLFLVDALHYGAEEANIIRVLSTAIPILASMFIVLRRKPILTLTTYFIVGCLLLSGIMVPGRWAFMKSDVLKFTIPVVVPIGLCIASVKNFPVLVKSMEVMSIIAAVIGILYGAMYLSGRILLDNYSMAFSYSILFPTIILIARKKIVWKFLAILLMIEMLAIGSRGALLLSITFWLFTIVWKNLSLIKCIVWTICIYVGYKLLFHPVISIVADIFDSFGVNSRTLRLLLDNELIEHDSGRNVLYQHTWELINQNPFFGNGVWADRQHLGIYCHNIFLELLLDYGYIGTFVILSVIILFQLRIFTKIPKNHKFIYVLMFGIVCPLFVSSSYLISYNLGMFLGFSYLLSNLYKKRSYQEFTLE